MRIPSFSCAPYSFDSRKLSDSGVQATISDKRRSVRREDLVIAYFEAEVLTQSDYDLFGASLPVRQWSAGTEGYRYGFNGKVSDLKTRFQDYGFRIYYPAIGKFLSVDSLAPDFPRYTPYLFSGNRPIDGVDFDGLEYVTCEFYKRQDGTMDRCVINPTETMSSERIQEVRVKYSDEYYRKCSKSFEEKGR